MSIRNKMRYPKKKKKLKNICVLNMLVFFLHFGVLNFGFLFAKTNFDSNRHIYLPYKLIATNRNTQL